MYVYIFKIQEALFIPREITVQQLQYKGGKVKYYRVRLYNMVPTTGYVNLGFARLT